MSSNNEEDKKKGIFKSNFSIKIISKIIYYLILSAIFLLIFSKCSSNKVTFDSSSNLINIDEVLKFNLAKFNWTGIAAYYNNSDKSKVDTFIKYDAEIIATMNMENFDKTNITIDKENKKIYITLPKIELKPSIIFKDDGKSFSFIPENTKIEMRDLVTICENDATKKVLERMELIDIAKENAKKTIEGLLLPLIEEDGYKIVWKDGE